MNLTKCFVAGLCLTALTASAGFIKTNAFEGEPSTGWWVGDEDTLTTRSVPNDSENGRASYGGTRPMADAANANVLKLDTEGGVWTNTIEQSYQEASIYADMLVKFVPSEELPDVDFMVKLAIAVTNGYLVVTREDGNGGNEWVGTSVAVDTSLWYRVTVQLTYEDPVSKATVRVNGTEVSVGGLTSFVITDNDGWATLKSIGFQGTGFIDEVAVSDNDPISTGTLLTLSFATGIESVFVGETEKTTGQTVLSGDTLVITAAQWKEIASLTGPETVTWVAGGIGSSVATVTVANASATTVTITAQTETSTEPIGGGTAFSGEESNKVATWALANGVTTLSNDMYDQYLLNIAEDAEVPDLLITSISVSGSTVTVTVAAAGVNFTTINGTLKLKSYPTLGGAETVHTITFSGTTTATITQDIGSNKFVKASVE